MQMDQAKRNLAKHLDMFATSGNLNSSECYKSYQTFEEAMRHPNLSLPITEDEMVRAYCQYVVSAAIIVDGSTSTE